MVSTNVSAEWTKFGDTSDYSDTTYIDRQSIQKTGDKLKIWVLTDFKEIQSLPVANSPLYLSQVVYQEIDCQERTIKQIELVYFSGNMRSGTPVLLISQDEILRSSQGGAPSFISPGSKGEVIYKIACNKK